ncbi:hypothetical protein [Xanthomonas sp. 3075]|uniref:hypothetical protein n=1 Tax=Xanthomonas sp. 3075 TaxID=3035315 RepID=UPI002DD61D18|nr:hypothetical protein [Xanthomonas sp. 3075]
MRIAAPSDAAHQLADQGRDLHLRAFCTGGDAALGLAADIAIHAFLHDLWLPLPLPMPFQQCHRICRTVCVEQRNRLVCALFDTDLYDPSHLRSPCID